METNDGRKLSCSAQDAVRRKAVQAVISGRMTQTAAAEIFGVTRTSVCLWVNAYKRMGEAGLASKRKGRPSGGKLSKEQEASIRKSVLGKNPGQLRLPGLLWTRELVGELIERRFGVVISRWTAITNQGHLSFSVFDGRFTVEIFQDFLECLVKQQAGQKIFFDC